nr:MAG TPA_asm: hypothetical protein [Caudoviricetes sp.]
MSFCLFYQDTVISTVPPLWECLGLIIMFI